MENKKTPINIDGVEYHYEDMTPEQQTAVNHLVDLDRKLNSARFNVDQLQVGRNAFHGYAERIFVKTRRFGRINVI
jgi:hypothetical protein